MATVFGKEGNAFYDAFCEEPDPLKRRAALDAWAESVTPAIQAQVSEELRAFIEFVTRNRWTEEGFTEGQEKLRRIQNNYPLVMDIKLRRVYPPETFRGELPAPFIPKPSPVTPPAPKSTSPIPMSPKPPEDFDDGTDDDASGRSSNDNRSDSMNPNNDAYQAAMDNHSNQMNPNNEAYGSSRGR